MLEFLENLARTAGSMAMDYRCRLSELSVTYKSTKDLVSEADLAIEKYICERIYREYPGHAILGEETGSRGEGAERWIIDPIDGTSSFVRGQPFFSISIAYEKNGRVDAGAVYAPVLGELFMAERGKGATCNGRAVGVSQQSQLNKSILATGFACLRSGLMPNNLPYVQAMLPKMMDMRRYGSAALDLAFVACGRLEGFWEMNLNLYDVAAGLLLVEEAGGLSSNFSGETIGSDCSEILATNGLVHSEVMSIFNQVKTTC